jgi:hypothetical protein
MQTKGDEKDSFSYDVCLSFAGEDRKYVQHVAEYLIRQGVQVFYDKYEEVDLWGKDLAIHLSEVYSKKAKYCVIFISEHYANKVFPSHEFKNALSRAVEDSEEYILPARPDKTDLPGLRKTISYIDLNTKEPEYLGGLIVKKLHLQGSKKRLDPSDFSGTYYINNHPSNKLIIKRIKDKQFRLESPNVWDGVGIFDGFVYFGIFKYKITFENKAFAGVWGNHHAIIQDVIPALGAGKLRLSLNRLFNPYFINSAKCQ